MKKIILLTGVLLTGIVRSDAQVQGYRDVLIGPVAGGGVNWVSQMTGAQKLMPSAYAGINLMAYSSQYFAWGGQVTASWEGYNQYYYGTKQTVQPFYLRMPLKGYFFFGDRYSTVRPYIHFGPSVAVKLDEKSTVKIVDKEAGRLYTPLSFNQFDLGLDGGAGVKIDLRDGISLNTTASYYRGLLDVLDDRAKHKNINQNVNVSVGLWLRLNK